MDHFLALFDSSSIYFTRVARAGPLVGMGYCVIVIASDRPRFTGHVP